MNNKAIPVCERCSQLRPLELHLFELAEYCELLGDKNNYYHYTDRTKAKPSVATTEKIGWWLKLSCYLDSVEINAFKYQVADMYCGTVADALNSDSIHYTDIATALTRFLYIWFAVEETCRFVDDRYHLMCHQVAKFKSADDHTVRAERILEYFETTTETPKNYSHYVNNLKVLFDYYRKEFSLTLKEPCYDSSTAHYGLWLVRNIRNKLPMGNFQYLRILIILLVPTAIKNQI